jgi:hypothetical protein
MATGLLLLLLLLLLLALSPPPLSSAAVAGMPTRRRCASSFSAAAPISTQHFLPGQEHGVCQHQRTQLKQLVMPQQVAGGWRQNGWYQGQLLQEPRVGCAQQAGVRGGSTYAATKPAPAS